MSRFSSGLMAADVVMRRALSSGAGSDRVVHPGTAFSICVTSVEPQREMWNTIPSGAMAGITWMAEAPVPTTATRLPRKSTE